MMNTREVAQYLRIKERKVYDLVRARKIPCARVTGKWLFPKALIDEWVARTTDTPGAVAAKAPPVLAGSHDLLLDWAARESHCGLALLPGGSLDGLRRVALAEAVAAGIHLAEADGGYNLAAVREHIPGREHVVLEWAKREQGLVVAPGNPLGIGGIKDLARKKARVITRQSGAGSRVLLERLLDEAGLAEAELAVLPRPALSEHDLGLAVLEGKADAGLAIRAVAQQLRLGFVPLRIERFDLVLRRRDYFEPPLQKLFAFARTPIFAARAQELGGYDVSGTGRVVWNP